MICLRTKVCTSNKWVKPGAKLEKGGMGGVAPLPPKYESSGLAGQSKILNDRM
jgi:hypothetical protein